MKTIIAGLFALGTLSATSAFASPVDPSGFDASGVRQVRTICDEYGRCFERRTDVGADIARGVLRGVEGRSVYRDRGYDRGYDRRGSYDRGDYRRPRNDYGY